MGGPDDFDQRPSYYGLICAAILMAAVMIVSWSWHVHGWRPW